MRDGVDSRHVGLSGRGEVTLLPSGGVAAGGQSCKDLGFETCRPAKTWAERAD